MWLGNVHGQPGDEVEDVQLDGALTVGAVGIDVHRGASAVIGDTRHHDRSSEHVSGDTGEGYLVVRCDGSPDVDIEPEMGPGEYELHAFPAQKLSLVLPLEGPIWAPSQSRNACAAVSAENTFQSPRT